ncbi:MAG: AhpC/TSA family protein [Pseudomonadota bacterium]|nr:AhpC/TSA family protein [Pseudomonadota bacterium]
MNIATNSGWRLLVIYRGKHCPLCRKYLNTLNELLADFREIGVEVSAVSADSREKAETSSKENDWKFSVAYDLSTNDMRQLGLYISAPTSPAETDRPFSEPALFVINPSGQTQVINVSNAPFARPELKVIVAGVKTAQEKHSPIHGTAG